MKTLKMLKLHEFTELEYEQMKKLKGSMDGDSSAVECKIKSDGSGCTDETAGKYCSTGSVAYGKCAFTNMYGKPEENVCFCAQKS